ncbi:MAG: hypothetical protein WCC71_12885, partial [Candidatus Sulfotelmatobacter sp.]
ATGLSDSTRWRVGHEISPRVKTLPVFGGFLAQVEPGTHFELQKMPVADGVWLPKHFAMRSQAKVLFFFTRKSQADETYYGYFKAAPIQTANVKSEKER